MRNMGKKLKLTTLGFTLAELLAAIVIISIILAIVVPSVSGLIDKSRKNAFEIDVRDVIKAIDHKRLKNENYNVLSINETNITNLLHISDENYQSVTANKLNDKTRIMIVGKNKWDCLVAYGDFEDLNIISCNEYSFLFPVITLNGTTPITVQQGTVYTDAGAIATDATDGDLTDEIEITNDVNTDNAGTYSVVYKVINSLGAESVVTRTVYVADIIPPVITILGDNPSTINFGDTYTDAGATAVDGIDGDITDNVIITSDVNTNQVGNYFVTYTVSDNAGNESAVTRSVEVVPIAPNTPGIFASPLSGVYSGETITVSWAETTSWGAPTTGSNYRLEIQYNNDEEGNWILVGNTGTTPNMQHTISATEPHTAFRYRVRAENEFSASAWRYSNYISPWLIQIAGTGTYKDIYNYNGRWLAVGDSGMITTSTDGITWTATDSHTQEMNFVDVHYSSGCWRVINPIGSIYTSTTGTEWDDRHQISPGSFYAIHNYNGRWVAVGGSGIIVTNTTCTIDWDYQNVGATQYNDVYNYSGRWVIVGNDGKILTSTDGVAWTTMTPIANIYPYNRVYNSGGRWVVVGDAGKILTSTDGTTWSAYTVGTSNYKDIYIRSGRWIAVGSSGTIATSTDGTTWTTQTVGANNYNAVYNYSGRLVAVGDGGRISTSTDGENWTTMTVGSNNYKAVYNYDGRWVVVGSGGRIISRTF